MPVEVIGIDHVFIPVRNLATAEAFYDKVMPILGFRRSPTSDRVSPRARYDNRQFSYWVGLRDEPPTTGKAVNDSRGVSHLCFRVVDEQAVDRAYQELRAVGIEATTPQTHIQYSNDYYATFFSDPDGLLLEVMNFNTKRRRRMYDWETETQL